MDAPDCRHLQFFEASQMYRLDDPMLLEPTLESAMQEIMHLSRSWDSAMGLIIYIYI